MHVFSPECNTNFLIEVLTTNRAPLCQDEIAGWAEYVSGIVNDFAPGVFSPDDIRGLWQAFVGSTGDAGILSNLYLLDRFTN